MSSRRRGLAILQSLWVVVMLLLFGLTLAALGSYQYQLSRDAGYKEQALEAALAGIARTQSQLAADIDFSGTLSEDFGVSRYRVTFDPAATPWSLNNLRSPQSRPGYLGQAAPSYSVLVFARGEASGRVVDVQAILQYAPYPYAVAATNEVRSNGPLYVDGAGTMDEVLDIVNGLLGVVGGLLGGGGGSSPPIGSVQAHVYADSLVEAGPLSFVNGKVNTPGTASFGSGSTVVGGIHPGARTERIPDIDIQRFSNSSFQDVTVLAPDSSYATLTGNCYVNGNITLTAAVLNNCYLFVDGGGDLTSTLGLTGTGTIFVTGKTQLEGALNIVASNGIALFSQEDLTIAGGNSFQGVLYSHGNIKVDSGLNVVGAVVSSGGSVEVNSAHVIGFGDYTRLGVYDMKGSLLQGDPPELHVVYWRQL